MSPTSFPAFLSLFPEFRADSWRNWRQALARIDAVREFYAIVGRGAGKSRIVGALAVWAATMREHRCAPGESIYIGIFAPDRKQAGVTFRYVRGLLHSLAVLRALIVRETTDSIELSNGVVIEVVTASTAAPRGRAYVLAIVEEAAFLPSDNSANPDVELIRALRPGLARVPNPLLAVVSSPYAQRGVMWHAWRKHQSDPSPDVLVLKAATLDLNPSFDRREIERAYADDPAAAAAEYGGEFRTDVETFVSREAIDAAVVPGRRELPPIARVQYVGFLDFAGGSGGDSATLAIAHDEANGAVLDVVREVTPPFSPDQVCLEFAHVLHTYGVRQATADRWAGQFPTESMAKHGIEVQPSDKTKSDIYREFLPLLNSGRIELLDHARLASQLAGLERRVARGGRDSIDHSPGSHDDVANAAAGALVLALAVPDGGVLAGKCTW